MSREISETSQEKPDSRTQEKNSTEIKNRLGEKPEESNPNRWNNRLDHARKVSKILGEHTGTVEPKTLKEKSEDTDNNKGGGGLPPGGDQGKRGGGSGSPHRSMAEIPFHKKQPESAETTEQKRREATWGSDQQRTTAQASRMDRHGVPQRQDRPSTPPDQGTGNTPRR